jgi:DNA-binding MarR family transcriptional regulator
MSEGDLGAADNVLIQMFRTVQAVRGLVSEAVSGTGVTPDEYAVLSTIGVLGPVAPTELAARLRLPPTTISRYVRRLIGSGLAARTPNPADGRSYLLELTTSGRAVTSQVAPRIRETLDLLAEHASVDDIASSLVDLERAARAVTVDVTAIRQ